MEFGKGIQGIQCKLFSKVENRYREKKQSNTTKPHLEINLDKKERWKQKKQLIGQYHSHYT